MESSKWHNLVIRSRKEEWDAPLKDNRSILPQHANQVFRKEKQTKMNTHIVDIFEN